MTKFIVIQNFMFNIDKIVSIEHTKLESEFQQYYITITTDELEYKITYTHPEEMLNNYKNIFDQLSKKGLI